MRTQARGLAAAVADLVLEKVTPPGLSWPGALARMSAEEFATPFPDLLVTCGRRSAGLAARLRRAGAARMIAVHVQDPRRSLTPFDLVIAMDFDPIASSDKVVRVATALHDVTAASLARAAIHWGDRLAALGEPLTGVMIGGNTSRGGFSAGRRRRLIDGLRQLRAGGHALAIATSRRTPGPMLDELKRAFTGDPGAWLWDGDGDNPYRGILALADRLVVTGDSVSMISEALATGAPVEVFDLAMPHFSRFIDPLVATGAVRRFIGDPSRRPRQAPIDATPRAAAAVRRLLQSRGLEPRTGSLAESCSRASQSCVT